MAYFRRDVQDHVTKMTKELYDNLQDGIDESKGDIKTLQEKVVLLKEESANTGGVISDSKEDVFSEDKEYKVGDLVIYNNALYKFIEDKLPGEWNEIVCIRTNFIELGKIINSISGKLKDMFLIEYYSLNISLVSGIGSIHKDISIEGYTPIALVSVANHTSGYYSIFSAQIYNNDLI